MTAALSHVLLLSLTYRIELLPEGKMLPTHIDPSVNAALIWFIFLCYYLWFYLHFSFYVILHVSHFPHFAASLEGSESDVSPQQNPVGNAHVADQWITWCVHALPSPHMTQSAISTVNASPGSFSQFIHVIFNNSNSIPVERERHNKARISSVPTKKNIHEKNKHKESRRAVGPSS